MNAYCSLIVLVTVLTKSYLSAAHALFETERGKCCGYFIYENIQSVLKTQSILQAQGVLQA